MTVAEGSREGLSCQWLAVKEGRRVSSLAQREPAFPPGTPAPLPSISRTIRENPPPTACFLSSLHSALGQAGHSQGFYPSGNNDTLECLPPGQPHPAAGPPCWALQDDASP